MDRLRNESAPGELPQQRLIIGLGTGRCGTVSLSRFLSAQPGTRIIHEGAIDGERHLLHWKGDATRTVAWLEELSERLAPAERVGDIGFYFLPYVEDILRRWPSARFVVLQRGRDATVRSYERKTAGRNHWMEHDGEVWRHDDRWDPTYPNYRASSKREALERYWDEYYDRAADLARRYPDAVRVFDMTALNSRSGRRALATFVGIGPDAAALGGKYHENALRKEAQRSMMRALRWGRARLRAAWSRTKSWGRRASEFYSPGL